MKTLIKKSHLAIAALSALAITACGVGGGLAGIGGSGYISTGTITSFGSVFVNGVEFETGASTFEIEDDNSGTQADLRIGMVVEVTGSINGDGITGNATHIKYGDDLQGPVTELTAVVAGANTRSFKIFGNAVDVSDASTTFEDVSFATIADGNVLEVSGFYDQNNVLQASYIEFKSASANADSIVEIKGRINNLNGNNFVIQGVNVNAADAILEDLPDGLQENLFVEVKGKLNSNVIDATEIESEDSFSEETGVELEGIVTRYNDNDNTDFDVNNQTVDATNAIFSPANLILKAGDKVEIQGQLSNGVFIASEVETREGSAGVSAKVREVNIATNSFTVEVLPDVLPGQLITVQLTTATRMKDEMGNDENLLLTELNPDDFVSVQGFESALDTTGDTITATEVKRESEVKPTELEGVVTQASASGFTVLGVTYPVDLNTSYDEVADYAEFLLLMKLDETVISISDEIPVDGFADSIEIDD